MTRSARSGQVCRLTAADLPPDIPLSAHHLCPLLSSCHSSSVPAFLVSRCPLALTAADQLRAQVVAAVSCFHPPSCCLCVCLCLNKAIDSSWPSLSVLSICRCIVFRVFPPPSRPLLFFRYSCPSIKNTVESRGNVGSEGLTEIRQCGLIGLQREGRIWTGSKNVTS